MTGSFSRGLAAGAAGTTVLNAVTYLDMAVRGRDASSTPDKTVDAIADAAGTKVPGRRGERDNRRTALGALSGIGNGVAVGVLASLARAAGVRLPSAVGAVATGAAAMALTDGATAALGVDDPRQWSSRDWVSDALPHLAYGAAVQAVVEAIPTPKEFPKKAAGAGLTVRSALLGVATGCRSSLGLSAPALTNPEGGALRKVGALGAIGAEVYADKLEGTPARTSAQGLPLRFASAAGGAGALAAREDANAALPILAGMAGAAAGSWGGLGWRTWASKRVPDWQAAVIEDGVALVLALVATLPNRKPAPQRITLTAV
ncbi:hypothetical protein ASG36_18135 [Geodermatophilus sp. Leaf369]|uniref:hypothetical protein n=1 Tax=Geodermatophilus sp. Leaf369 TaxID=1736354 RepID=UPI0006FCE767|nr:hypothetical protein [Geodermatophilus sp. Leaf369]KQS56919.1 hypothetical protein ASG36_18135 [Geodermatophilus sp. Leaf369]QNG35484.1 hypothetical protein F1C76_01660 [Geodermatophilaceae bacterium NBWT11]